MDYQRQVFKTKFWENFSTEKNQTYTYTNRRRERSGKVHCGIYIVAVKTDAQERENWFI